MELVGNRGYFHCEHCGRFHFPDATSEGVNLLGEPSEFSCPICEQSLQKALIDGEAVSFCESCRGFLTTSDAFSLIVRKRRGKRSTHEQVRDPFDPGELKRRTPCPRCHRRMDTHPYSGGGNAVIDSCAPCHLVWLDALELAVIERYIPHVHQIEPVRLNFGEKPADDLLASDVETDSTTSWWPF